jgi:hypothetical protein
MSTRAVITIRDDQPDSAFAIYRHHDGYPDTIHGVLATLPQALAFAWPLPRFEASDFAAAIVAAWKQQGGGVYMTQGRDWHGDLAYHYDLSCAEGVISVKVETPVYDKRGERIGWKLLRTEELGEPRVWHID